MKREREERGERREERRGRGEDREREKRVEERVRILIGGESHRCKE